MIERLIKVIALSLAYALMGGVAEKSGAAPRELNCVLTDIETKSQETKFESRVAAEKRPIVLTFDDQHGMLSLREGLADKPLRDVIITQISMNGAADTISLGIDRSSWRIVFQTYGQDSIRSEFGACYLHPKSH
jgi:hypothetical protein